MPTYQYACTDCDHAFEQVQSFSEDSLTNCPRCEGRLRKIFNAVGVVFKGSGFYRTDNRAEAKSASTTPTSNGSSGDSSSDSSSSAPASPAGATSGPSSTSSSTAAAGAA